MGRLEILLLAAAFSLCCAASPMVEDNPTAQSDVTIAVPLSVKNAIPRRATVGTRKAGMICLPNGRLKIEDFVPTSSSLAAPTSAAFLELGVDQPQQKLRAISLTRMDANLCARDYLMDRTLLSGKANFSFLIEWHDGSKAVEEVAIIVEKQQAQSEVEIMQLAVSTLLDSLKEKWVDAAQ